MAGKATEKIGPVSIKYYSITAKTLQEVVDAIGNNKEAGEVSWNPKQSCKPPESADVTVTITMELPKWSPPSTLSAAGKKEWKRWEKALRDHEDGHVDLVTEYMTGVADKMLECSTPAEAGRVFKKAVDDLEKASKAYDSKTGNGTKTGTILDTSSDDEGK